MDNILTKISAMYADMDKAFKGNSLKCKVCGLHFKMVEGEAAHYIRNGWPKHCGQTMRLIRPHKRIRGKA